MYVVDAAKLQSVREFFFEKVVVVTGANGALGLSLAHCFSAYKIDVGKIITLSVSTELDPYWSRVDSQFIHFKTSEHDSVAELISNEIRSLQRKFVVFHMAGYGQPQKFLSDSDGIIRANVGLLMDLLNMPYKPQALAFISTSEIYSGFDSEATESTVPVISSEHPRAAYVYSKLLAEALVTQWASKSAMRAASYRVGLAFPPKLLKNDSRVLGELLSRGINNRHVVLKGGRSLMRQYQYGPNAIIQIMSSLVNGSHKVYNCAGSHKISLGSLAELIANITSSELTIEKDSDDLSSPTTVNINFDRITNDSGIIVGSESTLESYLKSVIDNSTHA
jgi:UDP-glucuronate decarboxylase